MLEFSSCAASYGGPPVFSGVDLRVAPGGTAAVIGPSGAGKTTLLSLACGLLAPSAGSVTLDGVPVAAGDRRIGWVPQDYGLLPWLTARGNVELGLRPLGLAAGERGEIARGALAALGLAAEADRWPGRLSGGERQRVALARAFARDPEVLLLDEPFSSLDALTREALQETLLGLLSRQAVRTLLVTHSIEEAVFLGTSVFILAGAGTARLYGAPALSGARDRALRGSEEFAAAVRGVRGEFDAVVRREA